MHVSVPLVYSTIASEFSKTRYAHWNKVKQFIQSLTKYTIILDVGCGNGKYSNVRPDLVYVGCDITKELLDHADINKDNDSMKDLFQVSCERLPLKENTAGAAICIAVLHHIAGFQARVDVVTGILKTLDESGSALITVWAYEQTNVKKRDTKWKRVDANTTDYLIPWHAQDTTREVHWRFYHLFKLDETTELCECVIKALGMHQFSYTIEFEMDNWVVTFNRHQL